MVRIDDLTLAGLLDRVEDLIRRTAPGRLSVPARAYAADAEGRVTVFGFPVPSEEEGLTQLSAILQAELERRQAVMCVVALEGWAVAGRAEGSVSAGELSEHPDRREVVRLEGFELGPGFSPRHQDVRLLEIVRRGRKIATLRRLGASPADMEPSAAEDGSMTG